MKLEGLEGGLYELDHPHEEGGLNMGWTISTLVQNYLSVSTPSLI